MKLNGQVKKKFWVHYMSQLERDELNKSVHDVLFGRYTRLDQESSSYLTKDFSDSLLTDLFSYMEENNIEHHLDLHKEDNIYMNVTEPNYYKSGNMNENERRVGQLSSSFLLVPNPTAGNIGLVVKERSAINNFGSYIAKKVENMSEGNKLIVIIPPKKKISDSCVLEINPQSSKDVVFKDGKIMFSMNNKETYTIDAFMNTWRIDTPNSHANGTLLISEYVEEYNKNKYVHFFV